jgi:hypothetical protein
MNFLRTDPSFRLRAAVRWQRQDAGKGSGADGDHDEEPMRKPPTVAARTKALTTRAAPICRTNCWLVVALPIRATGTLFCTTTVSAGERNPHRPLNHVRTRPLIRRQG